MSSTLTIPMEEEDTSIQTIPMTEEEDTSAQTIPMEEAENTSIWQDMGDLLSDAGTATVGWLEEIGDEAKKKPLGPVQQAADMTYSAIAKSLAGAASLPAAGISLGLDLSADIKEGQEEAIYDRADDTESAEKRIAESRKDVADRREAAEYAADISSRTYDTLMDYIGIDNFTYAEPEKIAATTDLGSIMVGAGTGVAAGVARRGASTATTTMQKAKELGKVNVDAALGEAAVSSNQAPESVFADDKQQGSPVQQRVFNPLESLLFGTALEGAAFGVVKGVDKYKQVFDKYKEIRTKAEGNIYDESVTTSYLQDKYNEDELTGELTSAWFSGISTRSTLADEFAALDSIYRHQLKATKYKGDGSIDSLEHAPYNDSRFMRENKQGLSFHLMEGDESGYVAYWDSNGVLQSNPNVKSVRKRYADAKELGATVEEVSDLRVALDTIDNYHNIAKDSQDRYLKVVELMEDEGLYNNYYKKNKDKFNSILRETVFNEDSLLAVKSPKEIELKLDKLRTAKNELVKTAPSWVRKDLDGRFESLFDSAMRRPEMPLDEAAAIRDKYAGTEWGTQVIKDTSAFNNHMLDIMVDSGLMSAKEAKVLRDRHPNYLPNYKVKEDVGVQDDLIYGGAGTANILRQKRKVSSIANRDPIAAEAMYVNMVANASTEARIRKSIFDYMMKFEGEGFRLFSLADKSKVEEAVASIRAGKKQHFTAEELMDDDFFDGRTIKNITGKTKLYVDGGSIELPIRNKMIYDLISNTNGRYLAPKYVEGALRTTESFFRAFRNFIVYNPAFIAKTYIQEVQDVMVNSNTSIPSRVKTAIKSFGALGAKNFNEEAYKLFARNSGFYGQQAWFEHRITDDELVKRFVKDIEGKKGVTRRMVEAGDSLLRRVDFAPRIAYYNKLRKLGYSEDEALFLAKDLGVRFTQRGSAKGGIARFAYSIPFMRTTVNSVDRLARRVRFEGKKYAKGVAFSGMTTWALDKAYGDQDADIAKARRGLVIDSEDTSNPYIQYGFVTPAKPMHHTLDYFMHMFDSEVGNVVIDSIETQFPDMAQAMREADPSGKRVAGEWAEWIVNTAPRASVPGYDMIRTLQTETSFTGIPTHPASVQGEADIRQYTAHTSPTAVKLAELIRETTGKEFTPINIQIALEGSLPSVTSFGLQLSDHMFAKLGMMPEQDAIDHYEAPIIKKFFAPNNSRAVQQAFYGVHGEASELFYEIEKWKKSAESNPVDAEEYTRLVEENAPFLEIYEYTRDAQNSIRELTRYKTDLMHDRLPETDNERERDFFGSVPKNEALKYVDEQITDIMRETLGHISQLDYGVEIIEEYGVPYSPAVDWLMGATSDIGSEEPKIRKGKKTDESSTDDTLQLPNNVNLDTGEVTTLSPDTPSTLEPTLQDMVEDISIDLGVNPNVMMIIGEIESNFRPRANDAGTSTAKGLFQFTDPTWKRTVNQFGHKYGITVDDFGDERAEILMGIELTKDNYRIARNVLGRSPDVQEIYAIHMLGGGPDGRKFLEALRGSKANTPVNKIISSGAYKSNPNVFGDRDGNPRTVKEIYNLFKSKVNRATGTLKEQGHMDEEAQVQTFKEVQEES